jgi:hypothetical protein
MITRRAPGAKIKKVTTSKPARPPHERRHRMTAFKIKITARRAARRAPMPVSLRTREMIAVTALATFGVLAVTGIAAVISYSHMQDWALANAEPAWRARLFPLSVDGAILAASLVLYADSRAGRTSDRLATCITITGLAWSVGANIGHTWVSGVAAMMIAGWPPIAMGLSVDLLLRFVRRWFAQVDAEVRRTARRGERTPATPIAEPTPAATEPELKTEPKTTPLHVVAVERPDWLTKDMRAGDACLAYLEKVNPTADGTEVDREVGRYIKMSDGYARRVVRNHRSRTAAEEVSDGDQAQG